MSRSLSMLLRASTITMDEFKIGMDMIARGPRVYRPQPKGITIGELATEPVHPARLLAELAEEFDRGAEI